MYTIKKIFARICDALGYKFIKTRPSYTWDDVYKTLLNDVDAPTICDVGANVGQSIKRFRAMFPNPSIHSFEPDHASFETLTEVYGNTEKVILNNIGLGRNAESRTFYHAIKSGSSSFLDMNRDTEWCRVRSIQHGITPENAITDSYTAYIEMLDTYAQKHNLDHIHFLKIDTQGFEAEVLGGAQHFSSKKDRCH